MNVIGIDPSLTSTGISTGDRHSIIHTRPLADETQITGLLRRSWLITSGVVGFIQECGIDAPRIFIEAPMLRAGKNAGNHLFDAGWIMCEIFTRLRYQYGENPILVPTLTVKKFASGKGNTKKDDMKLAVYKKWGVEIPNDPGADALHAFVIAKYGAAMLKGEIDAPIVRRRGEGGRKKKAVAA